MADLRGKELKEEYANLLTRGPNGEVQDGEGSSLDFNINEFKSIRITSVLPIHNLTSEFGFDGGLFLLTFGTAGHAIGHTNKTNETVSIFHGQAVGTSENDSLINIYYSSSDLVLQRSNWSGRIQLVFMKRS